MKDTLLIILKFVAAVLLLPVVMASTAALQGQITAQEGALQHSLWLGLLVYLVLKFFVYDFFHVYQFGQGMVTACFQFLKPLVNAAPYVIPIYTVFVLLLYAIVNALGKMQGFQGYFFATIAFTFSMHIILTAQDLYKKDSAPGKPTYFFAMALIYIFDVFMIALVMNAVLPAFHFMDFFHTLNRVSADIYHTVFAQLFLRH